jgi:hypothetical protein
MSHLWILAYLDFRKRNAQAMSEEHHVTQVTIKDSDISTIVLECNCGWFYQVLDQSEVGPLIKEHKGVE